MPRKDVTKNERQTKPNSKIHNIQAKFSITFKLAICDVTHI